MTPGSSQDLLYIVLSLCIVWFTVFLCWLLYQAARVLRNANRIIENVTEKLELITDAVDFIKRKVDGLSVSMGAVSGMVSGLVEKFIVNKLSRKFGEQVEKRDRRETGRKRKNTERKDL
ncbi:MAG: hypothetical protein UY92_C0001G0008 [Candidatus Magasanikbacteria bacterium GW2011_GWA2_56_11]|uniref:DUF948 domain-containing protein n=1 Tax=Candidatus Magasanikbacteria bacterium GW2011_GWA2_56_11 TaxID=1619044 RepID=A0A0G2BBP6_9BACT|nr:MAG: hypothetical protein UY92_C0001G0008 [Candidatus Magasanikbacteria bacterium GW2011_GWA2_56_11]